MHYYSIIYLFKTKPQPLWAHLLNSPPVTDVLHMEQYVHCAATLQVARSELKKC